MGLKIKYYQCKDWEEYDKAFQISKYPEYIVKRENYDFVAEFEFDGAVGFEDSLWQLVYMFGTEDWYTNPKIKLQANPPLRYIQKSDVFTFESYGQYSFGLKKNQDSMGMSFPFDYFQDSSFD